MVSMEELARKLSLWDSRTFRPIMTHDDLEPIMEATGFVPLPMIPPPASDVVGWREYAYCGGAAARRRRVAAAPATTPEGLAPRPRLPFPRVDGLHLLAYKAFLEAFGFYIGADRVSDYFHVRAMPLTQANDRAYDKTYRAMKDCEMDNEGIFVYREGTLDHITKLICSYNINEANSETEDKDNNKTETNATCDNENNNTGNINYVGKRKGPQKPSCVVPLKDIITNGRY